MTTLGDSCEEFVVDTSLTTLFQTEKVVNKGQSSNCNNGEGEEDVEKLITLLNNYANWELRSLLVGIAKDNKLDALGVRLLGNSQGAGSKEEDSTSSDEAASSQANSAAQAKSMAGRKPSNVTDDSECHLFATRDNRSNDTRRSGSIGRRSARAGRLTRSLSSDRKLETVRRTTRDAAATSRQASILAKRRELDRLKHDSTEMNTSDTQKEAHSVGSSVQKKATQRNRSLSPAHTLRRTPVETRSFGRERKPGSADNLVGLSSCSFHAPESRRHGTRSNKNAAFNLGLGTSLHGTSSTERAVSSRPRLPHSPTGRNHNRRNNKVQPDGHSSPGSGRRRVFSSTKGMNAGREVSTPPPYDTYSPENDRNLQATHSSETGYDDATFLQFNPGSEKEKLTFFATSSRALTNATERVEELKSSTHDLINIVVGQPSEKAEISAKEYSGKETTKERKGFDFLLRKKRASHEKAKDKINSSDYANEQSSCGSDEESFA